MREVKLWMGVAVCIGILIGVLLFFTNNVVFVQDHKLDMNVIEHKGQIGFNLDEDAIHFGTVQQDGVGLRDFNLTHGQDEPLRVKIRVKGNITKFLNISETDFVLEKGEIKQINLTIKTPMSAKIGYYEGDMRVTFLKR